MADIFAGRGNAGNGDAQPHASAGDFDELPNVSRLMVGVLRADGKSYEYPPHSLIAWIEGSLLKGLFNGPEGQPRLFFSTSGLSHGFQGIESALANGNCEWKPPKKKK